MAGRKRGQVNLPTDPVPGAVYMGTGLPRRVSSVEAVNGVLYVTYAVESCISVHSWRKWVRDSQNQKRGL